MLLEFFCLKASILSFGPTIFVITILELYKVFLYFVRIIFCFVGIILDCLNFLYSIRSIWGFIRILCYIASILCATPSIFHYRTIIELCKIFLYFVRIFLFCRNYLDSLWTFLYSIISIRDVVRIFVFCRKCFVFCTNYFSFC